VKGVLDVVGRHLGRTSQAALVSAGPVGPVLDPDRWTPRHRTALLVGTLVALVAGLVEAARHTPQTSAVQGLGAFLAAGFAAGLVGFALTLRGVTPAGFLIGALFVTAGMLSWAYTDTPVVVWVLLLAEGALFLVWTFPWLRALAGLPRLGAAWLGLAYWLLGTLGAALVWHPTVAVQRLTYAGLFTLAAMAIAVATRRSGRDLSIGITAAFLCALAVLFLVGSGNALDTVHVVPHNKWGAHMEYRFWGGPGLLYHPNSIALLTVLVAVRIGAGEAFARWQRYAAMAVPVVVLPLANSRTGVGFLAAAAVVHAVMVWRRRVWDAVVPLALVVVITVASGGWDFLTSKRYGEAADVTSGRTVTWAQVWREFRADDAVQKALGDTKYARGYVIRTDTAADPKDRPKLTTDNALVGALRRGGTLGVLAFLFGLALLLWHGIRGAAVTGGGRRAPPAWFTIATVASVVTIPTADWLLGGTGGTMWVYLLAGEAFLVLGAASGGPAGAEDRSLATAQA
jgi:hypothetical protein